MWNYNYCIYITTNPAKTVLYIGVTNDIKRRLYEHYENRGNIKTFAGKYYCYHLVYYEHFTSIHEAIRREKELKGWSRKKKENLIKKTNPNMDFIQLD
jgi:putative endonuclease